MEYWPVATRHREDGTTEPLFTYDSVLTLEKAKEAIIVWERDYKFKIKDAHIDVFDNGVKIDVINVETHQDKVLHGLSSCGTDYGVPDICGRTKCPYREHGAFCTHALAHDAETLIATLLKAQEPVEPTWRLGVPFCSKCGRQFKRGYKYCPDCGKAVKWE